EIGKGAVLTKDVVSLAREGKAVVKELFDQINTIVVHCDGGEGLPLRCGVDGTARAIAQQDGEELGVLGGENAIKRQELLEAALAAEIEIIDTAGQERRSADWVQDGFPELAIVAEKAAGERKLEAVDVVEDAKLVNGTPISGEE